MIPGQQEQCESSVGGGLASTSLSLVVQNVTPVAVPSIVDKANPFQAAVVKVTPAVVEIKVIGVRAFDTCNAGTWKATGFVVDKAEGIILTNRHVIGPGPEVREAVFHNQEEVALEVIYTDPVHDFGFYRFNPKDVNFTEIAEIPLAPERAEIGVDIKVIGNDEGEKLSILSGILARLDRNAPNYGTGYNDFNTFYYQASSSTSGGSSGSPVIDIDGYAIALNAGGSNRGASSFFLPLDRVTRALDFIKGMLQVEKTIPSGPADKMLLPGDILFSVNGVATSTFIVLETVLDDGVGKDIVLEVRRAGAMLTVTIPIQDLHTITPTSFLEFAGDIMHDMSYQLARSYLVPCKGVHVAFAGYMMRDIGSHSLILSVDHIHTPTTADLAKVLATLPDGKHTPVRHRSLSDKEHEKTTVVQVDRKYFPASLYRRSATAYGQWESEPIPMPPKVEPKLLYGEANLKMSALNEMSARIATSLATVESHVPYAVLDAYYRHNKGCGVVLDAEQGLMLVDRHTVPGFFGTITVTFSNKIKIPAELVYQHPIHNFGVIKYNPSHIGKTPVRSIELCKESMQPGKEVHLGCMEWNNKIKARDISVSDVVPSAMGMRWPAGFFETNTDLVKVAAGSTKGRVLVNSAGQMLSFLAQHTTGGSAVSMLAGMPNDRILDAIEDISDNQPTVLIVKRLVAGTHAVEVLKESDIILEMDGRVVTSFLEFERAYHNNDTVNLAILRGRKMMEVGVNTNALSCTGDVCRVLFWASAFIHNPHRAIRQWVAKTDSQIFVSAVFSGSPADKYRLEEGTFITEVDGKKVHTMDDFLRAVMEHTDGPNIHLRTVDLLKEERTVSVRPNDKFWPVWAFSRHAGEVAYEEDLAALLRASNQ